MKRILFLISLIFSSQLFSAERAFNNGEDNFVKGMEAASDLFQKLSILTGFSSIHTATTSGYDCVLEAAITNRIWGRRPDINGTTAGGITALHLAARLGYASKAKILLKYKANINLGTTSTMPGLPAAGSTPLHIAAINNREEIIKVFIMSPDLNVDAQDSEGNTALHKAAASGNITSIKLLCNRLAYANPNIRNKVERQALDLAREELQRQAGAINAKKTEDLVQTIELLEKYKAKYASVTGTTDRLLLPFKRFLGCTPR
jgi:hypothetical protein